MHKKICILHITSGFKYEAHTHNVLTINGRLNNRIKICSTWYFIHCHWFIFIWYSISWLQFENWILSPKHIMMMHNAHLQYIHIHKWFIVFQISAFWVEVDSSRHTSLMRKQTKNQFQMAPHKNNSKIFDNITDIITTKCNKYEMLSSYYVIDLSIVICNLKLNWTSIVCIQFHNMYYFSSCIWKRPNYYSILYLDLIVIGSAGLRKEFEELFELLQDCCTSIV